MKNLVNLLIGLSAITFIIAIISRFTVTPILGIGLRAMGGATVILLLFAIAFSVKK